MNLGFAFPSLPAELREPELLPGDRVTLFRPESGRVLDVVVPQPCPGEELPHMGFVVAGADAGDWLDVHPEFPVPLGVVVRDGHPVSGLVVEPVLATREAVEAAMNQR
mgnify:FL=1